VLPLQGRERCRRPAYDPWPDAAGVSISTGARVEQVLVDRAHGALASRLGEQAQVIRRSRGSRLVVRFDGEDQPVSIRPDLVRLRPVSTGQILDQLEQLRDLVGDGDGR
jgi:phytoene dehydrogenase-like protein